jgi:hypothetical protein
MHCCRLVGTGGRSSPGCWEDGPLCVGVVWLHIHMRNPNRNHVTSYSSVCTRRIKKASSPEICSPTRPKWQKPTEGWQGWQACVCVPVGTSGNKWAGAPQRDVWERLWNHSKQRAAPSLPTQIFQAHDCIKEGESAQGSQT